MSVFEFLAKGTLGAMEKGMKATIAKPGVVKPSTAEWAEALTTKYGKKISSSSINSSLIEVKKI
ncbi:MAG: hypothetical protein LBO74_02685 [Candidatus Symbiothrix sp.]|jgi:hypothetical protein|nr:hypothetical protein [Candidatus Symbiothrix sp.]